MGVAATLPELSEWTLHLPVCEATRNYRSMIVDLVNYLLHS